MFYKVSEVKPLPTFVLSVRFENGAMKHYDVKPLFDRWDDFRSFESVTGLFEQVQVAPGGYGIVWNDDLDLSCNELYEGGVAV